MQKGKIAICSTHKNANRKQCSVLSETFASFENKEATCGIQSRMKPGTLNPYPNIQEIVNGDS